MASKSFSLCRALPTARVERMSSRSSGKRTIEMVIRRSFGSRCNVVGERCWKSIMSSSLHGSNRSRAYPPRVQSRCLATSAPGRSISPELETPHLDLLSVLGTPRMETKFMGTEDHAGTLDDAVKLAFSAVAERYGKGGKNVGVIGVKGSFQSDKYEGYFFDFPVLRHLGGRWRVEPPLGMKRAFGRRRNFELLGDAFDLDARLKQHEAQVYRNYIQTTLEAQVAEGKNFGAVVIEPVVSGRSNVVDPLFQHVLIQFVRENPQLFSSSASAKPTDSSWSGLPVIFDETFTGLYRLGRLSAASFINTHPDIFIHLDKITENRCVYLTSNELASSTQPATTNTPTPAHAKDDEASLGALQKRYTTGRSVEAAKRDWSSEKTAEQSEGQWSFWSHDFIKKISSSEAVRSVMALGSVLTVTLYAEDTGSWSPKTASGLQKRILLEDAKESDFQTRVSGDRTFYVLGNPLTKVYKYKSVQDVITHALFPQEGK